MTVRVVALGSPLAEAQRVGGTVSERLQTVEELTELGWTLSGRPKPTYTRGTIPVVVTSRAMSTSRD